MDNARISFTSANSLPVKIFKNKKLIECLNLGVLIPVHAQLIPTNRCNLFCKFCSCSARDRKLELSFNEIRQLILDLKAIGCKAVTITGGGEPLMHPQIQDIFAEFLLNGIEVGLVTNGLLLSRINLTGITWCRISCADERKFDKEQQRTIDSVVVKYPDIGWAFSYVLGNSKDFDPENLKIHINFANQHSFTHVRVVSDLINLDDCVPMELVKKTMSGIDDRIVIYQGRKEFDHGQKDCRISLLKPVIAADGYIYPCCGAQYAHKEGELDMPVDMRIGHIRDIKKLYHDQAWFDGSQCFRCYYRSYNELLACFYEDIQHKEFV